MTDEFEWDGRRLGWADWASQSQRTRHARFLFLEAIQAKAPEVLQVLRDEIYPLAKATAARAPYGANLLLLDAHTVRSSPHFADLAAALWGWLDDFGLDADWMFKVAVGTLNLWAFSERDLADGDEELLAELEWDFQPLTYQPVIPSELRRFVFTHGGWDATARLRSEFEAEVRADFEEALNDYLSTMEERLGRIPGLQKTTEKRVPEHFEWLVLRQCRGWTYRNIAEEYGRGSWIVDNHRKRYRGENAVKAGITVAARDVGLELRRGRAGRPRR